MLDGKAPPGGPGQAQLGDHYPTILDLAGCNGAATRLLEQFGAW